MKKFHLEFNRLFVVTLMVMCCFLYVTVSAHAETVYMIGDKGSAVSSIQSDLITLGYHLGNKLTDGVYDKKMASAVDRFQQQYNLKRTGTVDEETRKKLSTRAADVRKMHDEAGVPALFNGNYQLMESGSRSDAVKPLQNALITLGYMTGKATGKYDDKTVEAVKRYQSDHGMYVDGKAGSLTLITIEKSVYTSGGVKPGTGETGGIQRVLRYGDEGTDVTQLQKRLIELGYFTENTSGRYRSSTRSAVKAFQRRNGLTADGVCGEATVKLMFSAKAKSAETSTGSTTVKDEKKEAAQTTGRIMRYKDEGEDVKQLQVRLIELGYLTGNISGRYRSTTQAAVKAFQQRAGLKADGICGYETQQALYAADAPRAGK